MGILRRSSSLAVIAACATLLLIATACGGGDKATATTSGAAASPAGAATATATTGTTGGSSSAASPSATTGETATSAATTAATATTKATVASTPKAIATATATESAGAGETPTTSGSADDATATGSSDDPLADVQSINPEDLPNFTLVFSYDATNLDGEASTQVAMSIEQSAVDNYHLKFDASGQVVEEWLVDGTSYANLDGTVQEMPEGTGALIEPSTILTEVPLQDTAGLEKQGEEKVNGRNTTKYHLDGKNVGEFLASDSGGNASDYTNGGGGLDIWVDNDLKIMIKGLGDLTWTNPDGTDGEMKYNYEIKEIGSTPAVAAPQ